MSVETPQKSSAAGAGPALLPVEQHEGKAPIRLTRQVYVIGSRSNARIQLLSSSVSKAHALLVRSNGRCYIRDLASRTKLFINGRETHEADLDDGDLIKIGSFTFRYLGGANEDQTQQRKRAVDAKIEVIGADYPVPIEQRVLLVGRRTICDIALVEGSVSTAHAVIFEMDGQRWVRDLGSRTGTYVNGVSTHQHMLSPGDTVRVGETDMRYLLNEVAEAEIIEDDAGASGAAIPTLLETTDTHAAQPPPMPARPQPELSIDDLLAIEPMDQPPEPAPVEQPVEVAEVAQPVEPVEEEIAPIDIAEIPPIPIDEEPIPVADEALPPQDIEPPPTQVPAAELVPFEPAPEAPVAVPAFPIEPPPAPVAEADDELGLPEFEPVEPPIAATEPAPQYVPPLPPPEPIAAETPFDFIEEDEPQLDLPSAATAPVPAMPLPTAASLELPAAAAELPMDLAPAAPAQPEPALELTTQPAGQAAADLEINDSLLPFLEVPLADETPIPPLPPLEEPVVPLFTPENLEAPTVQSVVPPPRPLPATPKTGRPPKRRAAAPPPVAAQPVAPGREEIVEPTEPTPESALQSSADQIVAAAPPELPATPAPKSADDLTDTTFGREVREFVGNEIGEIVEPPPVPVEPTPFMPEPIAASQGAPPRIPPAAPPTGEVAAKAPRFEVPELKFPEGGRSPLVAPPPPEAPKAQPVSEMLKVRPPPPSRAPLTPPVGAMGLASAPPPAPAAPKPAPGQIAWGANQDNFLGGVPLDLRNKPTVAPAAPTSRSPLSNTPIGEQAVKDLIKQIDNTAAATEAAATTPPAQSDPASPLFAVMPPRPRRGPPGAQGRGAVQNPFGGGLIDVAQGSRAGGIGDTTINTGFDGLAISPLRDMDVFSQSAANDSDEFDPVEVLNEEPSLTPRSGPGVTQRPTRSGPVPPERPSQRAERATPRRIPPPPVAPAPAPANRVQAIPETLSSLGEDIPPLDIAPPSIPPAALPPPAAAQMPAEPFVSPILDEALPDAPEVIDGMMIDEHQPAPAVPYAVEPQETFSSPGSIRAKYVRRVSVLVTAMVVLIALGAWAIYNYVGVSSTVEGSFTFTNLAAMNKRARTGFQENQLRSLMDSQTRQNAKRTMRPEFTPGYLADQRAYVTLLEGGASFTDAKPDVLTIRISGTNAREDRERMSAILAALYEANQFQVNDALRARRRLEENNRNIENGQKELARINTEIEKLRVAAEAQPTSEQNRKLQTEVAAMEKSWMEAAKAAKDAQASLEQAKAAPVASAASVADDDQIKSMQAQVTALQSKLNAAKSATSGQAVAARKALDAALDAFQKQVTDAQSAMAGNPEAAAYIQTAQKTFENTRQVTEDLMRRQEQQFGSLMELKERWNEQMAQRRAQLWASDTRLQELTQKLSLLNRQYNAAVGSGLTKDAQEKKAEIDATQAQIKARQEQLPGDNAFADAIGQLETIIDNTKKNIAEDRRKTEQLLTTLQQGFTSSESVRKLPQDQQQVAQKMQQQMAQINEARRQYNQAIDNGAADSDTQTKAQIATLQASIEARRIQLAQQQINQGGRNGARQNQAAIDARQVQLDRLVEAETTARNAYFTKHKDLRDAQAQVADGTRNAEALDALIRQKDIEQRTLQTAIADTENRQREVNEAVEPMKPEPNRDIAVTTGDDRRLLYTLLSSGAILAVFFMMILWTLHTAALEEPAGSYEGFEMPPVPVSGPLNNNHKLPHSGLEHHKDDDTDEDHEPAII